MKKLIFSVFFLALLSGLCSIEGMRLENMFNLVRNPNLTGWRTLPEVYFQKKDESQDNSNSKNTKQNDNAKPYPDWALTKEQLKKMFLHTNEITNIFLNTDSLGKILLDPNETKRVLTPEDIKYYDPNDNALKTYRNAMENAKSALEVAHIKLAYAFQRVLAVQNQGSWDWTNTEAEAFADSLFEILKWAHKFNKKPYGNVILYIPKTLPVIKDKTDGNDAVVYLTDACNTELLIPELLKLPSQREKNKVVILVYGDKVRPGGRALKGKGVQEEDLTQNSALIFALTNSYVQEHYYNYNLTHQGQYPESEIYVSDCFTFLCDASGVKTGIAFIDYIVCAAPDVSKRSKEKHNGDKDMEDAIDRVFRCAIANNVNTFVVGPWGTGVFGNNKKTVGTLFGQAINKYRKHFDYIVVVGGDKKEFLPNIESTMQDSKILYKKVDKNFKEKI